MLALDDPQWGELRHAYGRASDIPEILKQLEANLSVETMDWQTEPWFSLWSALYHQGDVYTASYAAVPHIIRIGILVAENPQPDYFLLPTAIEVGRIISRGPEVPADLASAYFAAIQDFHKLAFAWASASWDETLSRAITAALIVSKGHAMLADAVLELTPEVAKTILAEHGHEIDDYSF